MIIAIDCYYSENKAVAVGGIISGWTDNKLNRHVTISKHSFQEYIPGEFYKRELPLLVEVLSKINVEIDFILIDAYVDLGLNKPGLGRRLVDALSLTCPVIGVAKTKFHECHHAIAVTRGKSTSPLYITSANIDPSIAAENIMKMYGEYRIPDVLREVDMLTRNSNVG